MVFPKVFLSSLILLLLSTFAFAADVGLEFTLVNAPPQIPDMFLNPLTPLPGTITFTGNASYTDLELQNGTMNFTWYVGTTPVASGGYFTGIPSGSTVNANPYTGAFVGGETVLLCVDVRDGLNPPVSRCVSTDVLFNPPQQVGCSVRTEASGGNCANDPITFTFHRQGEVGAFDLLVRKPDGTVERIYISSERPSYDYVPERAGSYYASASNLGGCSGGGVSVAVGSITPVVYLPVCSFTEMQDGSRNASDQPISISIVNNHGVQQSGIINVSWTRGGREYSVRQDGRSLLLLPQSDGQHHVTVMTRGCKATMDFTPNVCIGPNITKNETIIVYTLENKTFYVWVRGELRNVTCSYGACTVTADCCEGYCLEGVCTIPGRPEPYSIFPIKAGCYGIAGTCGSDVFCELLCTLIWPLVLAISGIAAYMRRKARYEAALLFMFPVLCSILIYPAFGLFMSFVALIVAFYRQETEEGGEPQLGTERKPARKAGS